MLEPAAGVGHFLGAMPRSRRAQRGHRRRDRPAVGPAAAVAGNAPHGSTCRIAPFEKLALPESWFDLVIGNVPFGNYPVADTVEALRALPDPQLLLRPRAGSGPWCWCLHHEHRHDGGARGLPSPAVRRLPGRAAGRDRLPGSAFAGLSTGRGRTSCSCKRHPGRPSAAPGWNA